MALSHCRTAAAVVSAQLWPHVEEDDISCDAERYLYPIPVDGAGLLVPGAEDHPGQGFLLIVDPRILQDTFERFKLQAPREHLDATATKLGIK